MCIRDRYHPRTLLKDIQDQIEEIKQRFKENPRNPDEISGKVFLKGITSSPNPIQARMNQKLKLLYQVSYEEDIYSNERFFGKSSFNTNERRIVYKTALNSYQLKDLITEDKATVHWSMDANFKTLVEDIGKRTHMARLNVIEKILVFLGFLIEGAFVLTRRAVSFKGIKIGYDEGELGIRIGSAVTVFGEVVYNTKDKTLRIDNPLLMIRDRDSFIESLRKRVQSLFYWKVFWGVLAGISAVWFGKKFKRRYAEWVREARRRQSDLKNLDFIVTEDLKCIICMDRARNVILKPCHHLCVCNECWRLTTNKICPVCKAGVDGVVDIFIS
eukprot:TRINITY_DN6995_c0_g1_i4.p1 TRINITY_DN6995_c0_g1~~TRINITY_DN6995_c0_g1_i4.p1  ORF type:complete len:364 (+),score=59.83 TRINITY_DN6995_c0_g1_i4:108-1094(+)